MRPLSPSQCEARRAKQCSNQRVKQTAANTDKHCMKTRLCTSFHRVYILCLAALFCGCAQIGSSFSASVIAAPGAPTGTDSATTPALSLAWSQPSPAYVLTANPVWTVATGISIASQSIQYYADGSCGTPSGVPVTLSASAATDSFVGANLSTYSYKITTVSTSGASLISACSPAISFDTGACSGARLTNAPYADGTGTSLDPYLICTATQMNAIGTRSADWSKSFKLANDIDMSVYTGTQYNIIGNGTTTFTGVFDGGNHTISNLSITSTADYVGLFGYVSSFTSEIKNLTLANVAIAAHNGSVQVGALSGTVTGGTVTNCKVLSGTVFQSNGISLQMVGGLIGRTSFATISNSSSAVTMPANNTGIAVGGLIASAASTTITDSSFTGLIQSPNYSATTGGLVGTSSATTVDRSFSTGAVNGFGSGSVGGLIGSMSGNSDVNSSYATGAVFGSTLMVGGLVGQLGVAAGHGVFNSYARGSVEGVGSSYVGGLIGRVIAINNLISNNYASGAVSITGTSVGGIIGRDDGGYGTYTNNFWNNQVNSTLGSFGVGSSAGATGVDTATLQLPANFSGAGWSGSVWNLTTSGTYLKLSWQP